MQGSQGFTDYEYRAPFNFPKSTALCFFKRQNWKCSRHKIHFLPHLLVHIPNQFLALFLLMVLDQG